MDFIIGGVAGAGATIFTNPMDVVKTRLQLQGELRARTEHTAQYKGIVHAMRVIGKTDGVFALQKGLIPAILLGFSLNSVRLGLYHVCEVNGMTKNKNGDFSVQKASLCSCLSGAFGGIAANPASVIKTRMQAAAHPSIAVGKQHSYKGTMDAIITIYRTEGIAGYFAGVHATCIRMALGSAVQLTSYSAMKEYLQSWDILNSSPIALSSVASIFCGFVVALVETPLDVAGTRIYNQGTGKEDRLYSGIVDCLRKIYKTEGMHGLYKGFFPLYWRVAPHTTLSLVIWDMLNSMIIKEIPNEFCNNKKINKIMYCKHYFLKKEANFRMDTGPPILKEKERETFIRHCRVK